jgi:hypothetical protein
MASEQVILEVHTRKGGTWQVDSTYPGREEAVEVAKSLYGEKRFEAIKVIRDSYDKQRGASRESTIYDSERSYAVKPDEPGAAPAGDTKSEAPAAARPESKPKKGGDFKVAGVAAIWLIVILAFGLGMLFVMAKMTSWMQGLY